MVVPPMDGVRVAVADREHRAAVLDGPLDEAAAGREVHDVVLVDPRRAGQQRDRVHLLGLRRVLDAAPSARCGTRPCPAWRRGCAPTSNPLACRPGAAGRRCCARRRRSCWRPRPGWRPPVSNARFSAAGLVGRKLVGASASIRKPVASAALASSIAFPAPASSRSLASLAGGQVGLPDGVEDRVVGPRRVREPLVPVRHRNRRRRVHPHPAGRGHRPGHGHAGPEAHRRRRRGGRLGRGAPQHRERGRAEAGRVHRAEHVRVRRQRRGGRLSGLPRRFLCGHLHVLPGPGAPNPSDATWPAVRG